MNEAAALLFRFLDRVKTRLRGVAALIRTPAPQVRPVALMLRQVTRR